MSKFFYFFILFFHANALASSKLPPILDNYPSCDVEVIDTVENVAVFDINELKGSRKSDDDLMQYREIYLQQALAEIQQQAQERDVEAIIIVKLVVAGINRSIDNSSGQTFRKKRFIKQFRIRSTAQFIKLCPDNKHIGRQPTPYNSQGTQVSRTETTVRLAPQIKTNPRQIAQKHIPPSPDVTPSSAYGIQISDPESNLAVLGPESVRLMLKNGARVYGYGRSLWFVVLDGSITHISTHLDILNGHGRNFIEFSDNYDVEDWVIAKSIHKRDPLEKVMSQIKLQKQGEHYVLIRGKTKFVTSFAQFKDTGAGDSATLLTDFSIEDTRGKPESRNVRFDDFSQIDIRSLLSLESAQNNQLKTDQYSNHFFITQDGEWLIASPNLLLGIKDGALHSLKITEAIIGEQSNQEFLEFLEDYGVPTTKDKFLARFPESEDNFDNVTIEREEVSLSVNFDSYDDDAQLIDLTLKLGGL